MPGCLLLVAGVFVGAAVVGLAAWLAPLQEAGAVALSMPGSYYERTALEYRERRDALMAILAETGFRAEPPAGAYYVMADYRDVFGDLAPEAHLFGVRLHLEHVVAGAEAEDRQEDGEEEYGQGAAREHGRR